MNSYKSQLKSYFDFLKMKYKTSKPQSKSETGSESSVRFFIDNNLTVENLFYGVGPWSTYRVLLLFFIFYFKNYFLF